MNVLISVIIPTYNRCRLLEKAIESVLLQTYKKFEIIIIDDCSTDKTEELIKGFKDDRIKYYRNETSLYAAASRNRGIQKSSGEFISFLDDDDMWMPEKLEKQINKFKNNQNLGLVYGGVKIIFENQNLTYINQPKVSGDIYKKMLIKNHIGVTPSVLIKRSVFNKIGLFDTTFPAREEYDLWIRIAKEYEIDYVDEPLLISYVRINLDRISSNLNNYIEANNLLNEKYQVEINNNLTYKEISIRLAEQKSLLGAQAIKINNKKLAIRYFWHSMKKKPSLKTFLTMCVSLFGFKATIIARKIYGKIFG